MQDGPAKKSSRMGPNMTGCSGTAKSGVKDLQMGGLTNRFMSETGSTITLRAAKEGKYRWPARRKSLQGRMERKQITWQGCLHVRGPMAERMYQGEYQNDKNTAWAPAYSWPDGKCYDGMWSNGKQHGEAKFTISKGRGKISLWENGERIKWLDDGKSSMRSKIF